jgi:predicted ATPase
MNNRRNDLPRKRNPYRGVTIERLSIETVVDRLRMAAENGDVQAQLMLAKSLELGIGTTADHQQALQWYKKAAETAVNMIHKEHRQIG